MGNQEEKREKERERERLKRRERKIASEINLGSGGEKGNEI